MIDGRVDCLQLSLYIHHFRLMISATLPMAISPRGFDYVGNMFLSNFINSITVKSINVGNSRNIISRLSALQTENAGREPLTHFEKQRHGR